MTRNIPNSITCCNLISGCIATAYAFGADYRGALSFIILGAIFDFFDGMVARILHVQSPIGKELDSLADVVTFGVAPSTMVFILLHTVTYPSFLEPLRQVIPYFAFVMAAFSALRLAHFNIDERQHSSFIGLPTPANALFWGSLIVGAESFILNLPYALAIILLMVCLSCWLLVSGIPMFALKFKQWGWHTNQVKYIFVLTCIPMLAIFGVTGIAIIIAWYVILSAFTTSKTAAEE
ncbi:MAG: CDP-diacylglycerol--serine O-phosphatidyltransferase [Prevotella sp.]|nr:CDP-diacylglycerol--serine O-phosphatidyltransferase [Prevotella sp.]